jgi:hypothetical protein
LLNSWLADLIFKPLKPGTTTMTKPKPETLLWLSDARGIYIPRDFANSFTDRAKHVAGVADDNWTILEAGPDHEHYWEAWDVVLTNATVTDNNGHTYTLHQDGDLWLIPDGMEWNHETENYQWPAEPDDITSPEAFNRFGRERGIPHTE